MSDASTSDQLADTVFQAVKVYVQRHTATAVEAATKPLLERLTVAEKALADAPKVITPEDVAAEVERQVKAIEIVVPAAEPGPKGDPGEAGVAGKDAVIDPAMVAAEVEKQISEIEIVVPAAIPGAKGEAGTNGKDGADAVVDYAKVAETLNEMVAAEIVGIESWCKGFIETGVKQAVEAIPKPADGTNGRDGRDVEGKPGKDAAEIVPLPMIKEDRAYAQGTWARHLGGLWRAERDTDPMEKGGALAAGWAAVVEGPARLDDLQVEIKEDGRTLVLAFVTASGRVERELTIPWPIDTGVWAAEKSYQKGDGVTYKGCWWIAQEATKDMPGTSRSWRMAVKSGRDGKDFRPDQPAPPREPMRLR